ncbi:hypothetical protein EC968_008346 [Mortierella alpina]|nr:hypothetical protein EC968_008346 [Mortierella alpina]
MALRATTMPSSAAGSSSEQKFQAISLQSLSRANSTPQALTSAQTSSPGTASTDNAQESETGSNTTGNARKHFFDEAKVWEFDAIALKGGFYDVTMGLSIDSEQIGIINSITLSSQCKGNPPPFSEIIPKETLQSIFAASTGCDIILLRRAAPYQVVGAEPPNHKDPNEECMASMEIRTSLTSHTAQGAETIKLHFIELQLQGTSTALVQQHRPHAFFLNASRRTVPNSKPPQSIWGFAISGDGTHAATLTSSTGVFCVDLWDIRESPKTSSNTAMPAPTDEHYYKTPIVSFDVPVPGVPRGYYFLYKVSLSWDASQVALLDGAAAVQNIMTRDKTIFPSAFAVYDYCGDQSLLSTSTSSTAPVLRASSSYQHIPSLADFSGIGTFHVVKTDDYRAEDELFVACDGLSVHIYSVHGQWNHLRTIQLSQQPTHSMAKVFGIKSPLITSDAKRLINSLRGPFYAWDGNPGHMITVHDIRTGSIVSSFKSPSPKSEVMTLNAPVAFSADTASLAIYGPGVITTRNTATGALLGTFIVPEWCGLILGIHFVRNDTQILVETQGMEITYGKGRLGIILDAATMTIANVFLLPGAMLKAQTLLNERSEQCIFFVHGVSLGLTRLLSRTIAPYSHPESSWNDQCSKELVPFSQCPREFTATSGLHFAVALRPSRSKSNSKVSPSNSVVVTVSDPQQSTRTAFIIPPYEYEWEATNGYSCARFLESSCRLVVVSRKMITIWALPSSIEGEFSLLLAWGTPWKIVDEDKDDYWRGESGPWHVCSHQQLYARIVFDDKDAVITPQAEHAFTAQSAEQFNDGLVNYVMRCYGDADESCRKALLRYVGSHMSSYPNPDTVDNPLLCIFLWWVPEWQIVTEAFVEALLDGTNGTWTPRKDRKGNPLTLLYGHVTKHPRAMVLAETFINYCIRQARMERDARYLQPILQTIWGPLEPRWHQVEHGVKILRRLAFFKVPDRQFILDHHTIAHRPTVRWRFWRTVSSPLYSCKDPILQYDHNKNADPLNDNFTRELYEAHFEMLWRVREGESAGTPFTPSPRSDSLDNPAIAALVQYKWNTFGYKYWLLRFLFQLCYYVLVLYVVFRQINNSQFEDLTGVCYAIIAYSIVFLWLEMIEYFKDRKRYTSSMYNVVDHMVFALPLAASINHLLIAFDMIEQEHNIGLFSFSVLFIFLHFLFELRVVKSMCYFVTIIIQAIRKIKVFFFIFALGMLTFTVGNLHLLRGFSFKGDPPQSEFPRHFYSALTATYFFMGGRYDQIGQEMNGEDGVHWEFQMMMIIFFFFTVILMLNVLIALINKAFSDGDETWRLVWLENRLRIVESAEDMSFRIPGFRESHNWFPESIYYSATPQQIRAYQNKYFEGQEEFITNTASGVTKSDDEHHKPFDILSPYVAASFVSPIGRTGISHSQNMAMAKDASSLQDESMMTLSPSSQGTEEPSSSSAAQDVQEAELSMTADDKQLLRFFEVLRTELAHSRKEISSLQEQLQVQQQVLESQNQRLEEQLKEQGQRLQESLAATLSAILASSNKSTTTP